MLVIYYGLLTEGFHKFCKIFSTVDIFLLHCLNNIIYTTIHINEAISLVLVRALSEKLAMSLVKLMSRHDLNNGVTSNKHKIYGLNS